MFPDFLGASGQLDAASFTTPAGVNLCLNDPKLAAKLLRRGNRLIGRFGGNAFGYWYAVIGK